VEQTSKWHVTRISKYKYIQTGYVTGVGVAGRVIGQGYVPPPPHKAKLFVEKIYTRGRRGIPLPHRGLGPSNRKIWPPQKNMLYLDIIKNSIWKTKKL